MPIKRAAAPKFPWQQPPLEVFLARSNFDLGEWLLQLLWKVYKQKEGNNWRGRKKKLLLQREKALVTAPLGV